MKLSDFIKTKAPLLLALLVVAVCAIPNICLSITELMPLSVRLVNILIPIGCYFLLMSITKNVGKAGCWMFILMFFAAFQIVLLYLFGRSVIAVDMFLNLVTTNPEEVGELLGNMLPIIIVVAVLYIPTLALSIVAILKHWRLTACDIKWIRNSGTILAASGILISIIGIIFNERFNPLVDLYPVNVGHNIQLAVERTIKMSKYHQTSSGFTYVAKSAHPDEMPEIYIAVIGETSRAPQWHILGYTEQKTTEPIDTLHGLITFKHAISESNTTHKSVPMLLSSLDASTFEDSIYTHKSLITAFKEAGFSTAFISNQARNHSFIDFFGEEADTTIFLNDTQPIGQHAYDMALVDKLIDLSGSNNSRKQLYVVHCYGSHFSYPDRYPKEEAIFLPDNPVDVTGSNNTVLLNAYNNTIHYTSNVIARLTDFLKSRIAIGGLIYASDHGEDIFDDDRNLFLHASPFPSYYQIHVPFLVWLTPDYIKQFNEVYTNTVANSPKQISSSASYFHTLMTIAGLESPYFNPDKSVADSRFTPRPHIYLNDHNIGLPLKDSGLLEPDFRKFSDMGFKAIEGD